MRASSPPRLSVACSFSAPRQSGNERLQESRYWPGYPWGEPPLEHPEAWKGREGFLVPCLALYLVRPDPEGRPSSRLAR
jgi:hypothetical protein